MTQKIYFAFGVELSDRKYRLRLARYAALAEVIADNIQTVIGERDEPVRLLDAGVGSGRLFSYLKPYDISNRIEFHGIDNDPDRIEKLYSTESYHKIACGDITQRLDYNDNTFDIVVCEQVLEHIDAPKAVLNELARVLRPKGLLVVGVPTFTSTMAWIRRHIVPKFDKFFGRHRGHVHAFTTQKMKELIEQTDGIEVKNVRGFRIISGGIFTPLENHYWWYRLNRKIGRLVPWLCVESQFISKKVPRFESSTLPAPRRVSTSTPVKSLRWAGSIAAVVLMTIGMWFAWNGLKGCPLDNLIRVNQDKNDVFYSLYHPILNKAESLDDIPVVAKPGDLGGLLVYEEQGYDIHLIITELYLAQVSQIYPDLIILGRVRLNGERVYLVDLIGSERTIDLPTSGWL